jgi:hypothetical protein
MRRTLLVLAVAVLVLPARAPAWTWPTDGAVLRPFVLGSDPYAAGQHRGVDLAGEPGSPVRAAAGGTVTFAGTVPGGGKTLSIRSDDYSVTLQHLGTIGVDRGAGVALQRQRVGRGPGLAHDLLGRLDQLAVPWPGAAVGAEVTADHHRARGLHAGELLELPCKVRSQHGPP